MAMNQTGPELRSRRLLLRRWRDSDLAPFAALNADPEVMEHFPKRLSRDESDAFVQRIEEEFDQLGHGLWAMEVPDVAPFIGFVGLHRHTFSAPFTPAVEVGWRLARPYWGFGYATEAAREALSFGFGTLGLSEIVSFTTPANAASWRVMERLGLTHNADDDFDHPNLPEGHRLRRHVLYRIRREDWLRGAAG
jgi:RimJ/RimL family protein N-acetyltransferase